MSRWSTSATDSQLTGSAKSMLRSVTTLRWVPRVVSAVLLAVMPSLEPAIGTVAPGLVIPALLLPASGAVPAAPSTLSVMPASDASEVFDRCMASMRGLFSTASRRAPLRCIFA